MAAMKWWGWGDDGIAFTDADKPALAPFIKEKIGLDVRRSTARPVPFDALAVPDPALPPVLRAALEEAVGTGSVSDDPLDRVVHGRGKSLRDLVLQRRGELGRLPDAVVRPGSEEEVAAVLAAALEADAVVIPFGGGTNISGSLDAPVGRAAAGAQRRPRPAGPRARDRCGVAPRAGAGGRLRAGARGAAQRVRLDARALPRQLQRTRRSAAGSRRARRACSPTSTATWPT